MNLDGHNQLIDDLNDWDILQSLPYAQTAEQFKLIDNILTHLQSICQGDIIYMQVNEKHSNMDIL